jgi:transposase
VSKLFGPTGRRLLAELELPQPWRGHTDATIELIDDLDLRIRTLERELARSGADHRYVPLLMTVPATSASGADTAR